MLMMSLDPYLRFLSIGGCREWWSVPELRPGRQVDRQKFNGGWPIERPRD